jgi:hypothetical protein
VPASCISLGSYAMKPTYSTEGPGGADAGSCPPSGGVPNGTVTPAPLTICCEP